jgi:outer membrane lipoprotein-sorting protein
VNKKKLVAIDLTPNDKKKNYFKIRLWIEKSTNLIQMGKVFQKNGNNLIYTIKNLSQQPTATDKEFAFDRKLYPGVEVIDMR